MLANMACGSLLPLWPCEACFAGFKVCRTGGRTATSLWRNALSGAQFWAEAKHRPMKAAASCRAPYVIARHRLKHKIGIFIGTLRWRNLEMG